VRFCALGPPSCESMAPTPYADASVNTAKGLVKLGCLRTGYWHIKSRSFSKACCCSSFQCQGVMLCVRRSKGFAIFE
jgi:hypothetical protein